MVRNPTTAFLQKASGPGKNDNVRYYFASMFTLEQKKLGNILKQNQ